MTAGPGGICSGIRGGHYTLGLLLPVRLSLLLAPRARWAAPPTQNAALDCMVILSREREGGGEEGQEANSRPRPPSFSGPSIRFKGEPSWVHRVCVEGFAGIKAGPRKADWRTGARTIDHGFVAALAQLHSGSGATMRRVGKLAVREPTSIRFLEGSDLTFPLGWAAPASLGRPRLRSA